MAYSISIRSPNVTNMGYPFDYQFTFSVQKGDYFYSCKEWERELGEVFENQEIWAVTEWKRLWIREKYYDKTSSGIKYNQFDLRYKTDYISCGYALRHIGENLVPNHSLVLGRSFDKRINLILLSAKLISRNEILIGKSIDYLTENQIKIGILQNVNLVGLFKYNKVKDKEDFQFKIMFEVEIPQFKKKGN